MLRKAGLALLVFLGLLAAPAASPVSVGYVYSDSMEPTIPVDGGFVVVPAGDVEPGEIIVFRTQPDRPVTAHRVVRETDRGFVTKGDNNRVTDQAAGHPYVERSDVRGEVLTVRGTPVVVPGLGVAAAWMSAHLAGVGAVLVSLLLVDLLLDRGSDRPRRSVLTSGRALDILFGIAFLSLVTMAVLGGSTVDASYVALAPAVADANDVTVGQATETTVRIRASRGGPLTTYVVGATGVTVESTHWNGSHLVARVRVPPPPTAGHYQAAVRLYRYPRTVPAGAVARLHAVHPGLAAGVTTALLLAPLYLLGLAVFGRDLPLRVPETGLERRLRRLRR